MKLQTKIDWIFFDVGGVLVDNDAFESNRKESIIQCLGTVHEISDDEYKSAHKKASAMNGNLTENIVTQFLSDLQGKQDILQKILQLQSPYFEGALIREDALETVRQLSSSYKLGIIANQPLSMRNKLAQAHLLDHFSHVGLSEEQGYHKPDKRLFHAIFEQTEANPANSVMIDDNIERGLLPAHELQMKTCWYKLVESAKPSWVDFEIRSLSDLLTIF